MLTFSCHYYLPDSHLGKDKLTLKRLSLTFASPNAQNERNLNIWQVEKVLSDVNNKLIHKCWCNVQAINCVVHIVPEHNRDSNRESKDLLFES